MLCELKLLFCKKSGFSEFQNSGFAQLGKTQSASTHFGKGDPLSIFSEGYVHQAGKYCSTVSVLKQVDSCIVPFAQI